MFHPPLSGTSAMACLSGWDLMLHCEKCGLRRKPVDEVKIHRSIELRDALPRLVCDKCRTKPPRITASCAWVRKYGPSVGDVDLTWIAQGERRADAA